MENFAVTSLSELSVLLVAIFGAFAGILVGFYNYAKARENDFAKSRDNQTSAFNKTIDKLGIHLDHNTNAIKGLREETITMRKVHEQGYKEAEQRNGHLAELTIEARDSLLKRMSVVDKQNIKNQVVENQTVENKE